MSWRDKLMERAFTYATRHKPLSGCVVFRDWQPLSWHRNRPSKPSAPGLILADLEGTKFYVSVRSDSFASSWVLMDLKNYDVSDSEVEARVMLATCQRKLVDWIHNREARQWPEDTESHFLELATSISEITNMEIPNRPTEVSE